MPCVNGPDATFLFFTCTNARKLASGGCAYPFPRNEVEEVLPVAGHSAFLQFAALLGEVRVLLTSREPCQLGFASDQGARHEVDKTMYITGDKVDGTLL